MSGSASLRSRSAASTPSDAQLPPTIRDVNRRLALSLGRLVAFAEDAPKLDFNEDRVLTWLAITTNDARNAIKDADGGPVDPVFLGMRNALDALLKSTFAEHKDDGWCSRTTPDVVVAACLALLRADDALKAAGASEALRDAEGGATP